FIIKELFLHQNPKSQVLKRLLTKSHIFEAILFEERRLHYQNAGILRLKICVDKNSMQNIASKYQTYDAIRRRRKPQFFPFINLFLILLCVELLTHVFNYVDFSTQLFFFYFICPGS